MPTSAEEAEYGKGFWTENWTGGHRYWAFAEDGDVYEIDLDSSKSLDSSIKSDLEAVLSTGDRNAIHQVVDDSGYGEKMMDAVGEFLASSYGYSWEEDAEAETWTVHKDEGAGDLVGVIIDEDIANVNAEALVRNNLDWNKSVQDVCTWVVDQLGLPAPVSTLNSDLGTKNAELNEDSISSALAEAIAEDPNTPTVIVQATDTLVAYITPAGYGDNRLVTEGKFAEAQIYVSMISDYKYLEIGGHLSNEMLGSEVVGFIEQAVNLNSSVSNSRVERTDNNTWIVRGDSDRFGKDAILYESYAKNQAEAYAEKLKAQEAFSRIELDETQLKKLYDIAEIYNTSNPISGSWEHEVEHEQAAISKGLGVSIAEAKEIMKEYLGFDDFNFE